MPRLLALLPQIIRIALDLRSAAQSRHTRTQVQATGLAILIAAVILACAMALMPGLISYQVAVEATLAVAVLITPLLSRGLAVARLDAGPSRSSPPVAVGQPAGVAIIAVRSSVDTAWHLLTAPVDLPTARLLGCEEGYDIQGVVYDLATGQPTGKQIRVAPSIRRRFGGQDGGEQS